MSFLINLKDRVTEMWNTLPVQYLHPQVGGYLKDLTAALHNMELSFAARITELEAKVISLTHPTPAAPTPAESPQTAAAATQSSLPADAEVAAPQAVPVQGVSASVASVRESSE